MKFNPLLRLSLPACNGQEGDEETVRKKDILFPSQFQQNYGAPRADSVVPG
jgi:hypothetical protein